MSTNNIDEMVLATQRWLNLEYGKYVSSGRFNSIPETGKTGWTTIYGLTRALQIELGIQNTADNFGPTTESLFNSIKRDDGKHDNMFAIVQGALWCKGYNPGHYARVVDGVSVIDDTFDKSVEDAIKELEDDAGRASPKGIVDLNVMKALLSMDSFVAITNLGGSESIRVMQQHLNRNYENYIGLSPCDGIYGRNTNKALIYALQAEEGLSTSIANGNFGPSTKAYCPTIPYNNVENSANGTKYQLLQISNFIKLLQIALYCNGYGSPTLTGTYDPNTTQAVRTFQQHYALPVTGIVNLSTWMSLMVSSGDTSRTAVACDTATQLTPAQAQTLYNNGYRYVGRYVTKVEGGLDKNLTLSELETIFNAGLKVIPIFQESGRAASAFTYETGRANATKAYEAALNLKIPEYTTIYFAVDYDPQQDEIYSNISPYFQGICEVFVNEKIKRYGVGVYGTRNVCRIVKELHQVTDMYVADASTGYSGNLGFTLPDTWCFDQFQVDTTVGTGSGQVSIDRVAYSGRDQGFNEFEGDTIENVYNNLVNIYNEAMSYTNNNIENSNKLVLQYLRDRADGAYGGQFGNISTTVNAVQWSMVAGDIDKNFVKLIENKYGKPQIEFNDPSTQKVYDLKHFAATLNAIMHTTVTDNLTGYDDYIDIYAGWGGDMVSFSESIASANTDNKLQWAKEKICTEYNTRFKINDYFADIDAVNISKLFNLKNTSISSAFYNYFIANGNNSNSSKRTTIFIQQFGQDNLNYYNQQIVSGEGIAGLFNALLADESNEEYIEYASTAFIEFVNNEKNANR